jgi:plastocyanin
MSRRSVRRVFRLLPVAVVLLLGACGGGGGGVTKQATNGQIEVGARDISFDVETIEASPGPLNVTLREQGSLPHTFTIKDRIDLQVDSGKKEATGTVDLPPGEYSFICTTPGHASMKGTVKVG